MAGLLAVQDSVDEMKRAEMRAVMMASPDSPLASPNLSGNTGPTEGQVLVQMIDSATNEDGTGYAFMYIMDQFMGRIDDYSTQVQQVASNDQLYNTLSNDLTKVQQDVQNMSNPPSTIPAGGWPTVAQLTAFKTDLDKLNADLVLAHGLISNDAWTQINNSYQMIVGEKVFGGDTVYNYLTELNDPNTLGALQAWFQNNQSGNGTPSEQPAVKNWLQNGETITLPNGQTVSALDLGDLGTQVNTVITNTNQELQQYGTEIQQCVQSAQTSNTAVSQEENNYVTNQVKQ